jgi:hypothetical protein
MPAGGARVPGRHAKMPWLEPWNVHVPGMEFLSASLCKRDWLSIIHGHQG